MAPFPRGEKLPPKPSPFVVVAVDCAGNLNWLPTLNWWWFVKRFNPNEFPTTVKGNMLPLRDSK
ncbi:MAG: hypothetical protein RMK89_11160 [Armatimonadota bacterium]|nr:hypothetical protein [Armatimonadota bacterium]MDW8144009.1 hypothetical protein [Armatimonadota bacterium]